MDSVISVWRVNPFTTAVLFWGTIGDNRGQFTWNLSGWSPKRDWSFKGVDALGSVSLHPTRYILCCCDSIQDEYPAQLAVYLMPLRSDQRSASRNWQCTDNWQYTGSILAVYWQYVMLLLSSDQTDGVLLCLAVATKRRCSYTSSIPTALTWRRKEPRCCGTTGTQSRNLA